MCGESETARQGRANHTNDAASEIQISRDGGEGARWGQSGELFYRNGEKVIAVELTVRPALNVGRSTVLFERPYLTGTRFYDVEPDGQRFLMVKEDEQAASATQVNIALNWLEELKQRVPTR